MYRFTGVEKVKQISNTSQRKSDVPLESCDTECTDSIYYYHRIGYVQPDSDFSDRGNPPIEGDSVQP